MSLILDALSRAERDKQAAEVRAPDLLSEAPEQKPVGLVERLTSAVWLKYLVIIAVALIVALGIVLQGRPDITLAQAPTAVPQISAGIAGTGITKPTAAPELPAPDRVAASASASPEASVATTDDDETRDTRIAALYAQDAADELAGDEHSAAPSVASKPQQAQRIDEEINLSEVLSQLRVQARSDGLAPHPVPMLADLSKQFRDRVPTLMYSQHDFATQGRSRVLINGSALRLGQRTRGVEVREILPDSVILRFSGTDFRLRALNSWVNL